MLDRHPPSSSPQPPPPPAPARKPGASPARKCGASPERRKRGGQPGNQNARKLGAYSRYNPGPLSHILDGAKQLNQSASSGSLPPHMVEQIVGLFREQLNAIPQESGDFLARTRIEISLSRAVQRAILPFLPLRMKQNALERIARDPFDYFRRWYERANIYRDADSFFIVSKKKCTNFAPSVLAPPPGHQPNR